MSDKRRTLAGLTLSTLTTKHLGTNRLVPIPIDRVAYTKNVDASAPHSHFRMTQPVHDLSLRYTFLFRTTREGSRIEVPLDIGLLVNNELIAVERGQEPIWVNELTSGLTGTLGVSHEFKLGDKVQPVLINRGIGCDVELSSVSLDLYDGRVNVTYSTYNNYTDIINVISDNLIEKGTEIGQMTYWNGEIWAHTEIDNLIWEPETSRMGIGVPVPAFRLDVAGTGQFTGVRTGSVQFDTSVSGIAHAEGLLHWDDTAGTLELGMPGGNVHHRIGQEILCRGKNNAGVIIPKGAPVRVNGVNGANPTLTLANATTHIYAMGTIAVASEEIAIGQFGYVTATGRVMAMDTSMAMADGAPLFLSATDGVLSGTLPAQPITQVFIGIALRKHATEGVLLVKIIPNPNIEELSNILVSSIADRDVLVYDEATTTWQNTPLLNQTVIPDNQIAVGTGTGIEGDPNFTWDSANFTIGTILDHSKASNAEFLVFKGVGVDSWRSQLSYTSLLITSDVQGDNKEIQIGTDYITTSGIGNALTINGNASLTLTAPTTVTSLADTDGFIVLASATGLLSVVDPAAYLNAGYWDRTGTTLIAKTTTDAVRMDVLEMIDNAGTGYVTVSSIGKFGDVTWTNDTQLVSAKTIDTRIQTIEDNSVWRRDAGNTFLYTRYAGDKVIVGGITTPLEALEVTGNFIFTDSGGSGNTISAGKRLTNGTSNSLNIIGGAAHTDTPDGGHTFITGGLGGAASGTPTGGNVYIYGRTGDGYGAVILGWDGVDAQTSHVGIGRVPNITLDVNGHFGLVNSDTVTANNITDSTIGISAASLDTELVTAKAVWDSLPSLESFWTRDIANGYIYPSTLADKVGIGTVAPIALLDVAGHIAVTSTGESIFLGEEAGLADNLNGNGNIFVGYQAAKATINGTSNIAIGYGAFIASVGGHENMAIGYQALSTATYNNFNMAIGWRALRDVEDDNNIAIGYMAMQNLVTGNNNTALGQNVALVLTDGSTPLTIATDSVYIGSQIKPKNNDTINEVIIGANAKGNGDNTVTIGNSSVTHNYFTGTVAGADAVLDTEYITKGQLDAASGTTYWGRTGTTLIPVTSTDTVRMDVLEMIDNASTGYTTVSSIGKYGDVSWASDTQLITAKTIDTRIQVVEDDSVWRRDNGDTFLYTRYANDKVIIGGTTIPLEALEITGNMNFTDSVGIGNIIYAGKRVAAGTSNNLSILAGDAHTDTADGGHIFITGGLGGAASGAPNGGNVYIHGRSGDGYGAVILGWDGVDSTMSKVGIGRVPNISLDVNGHFGLTNSTTITTNEIIGSGVGLSAGSLDTELVTAKAVWDAIPTGGGDWTRDTDDLGVTHFLRPTVATDSISIGLDSEGEYLTGDAINIVGRINAQFGTSTMATYNQAVAIGVEAGLNHDNGGGGTGSQSQNVYIGYQSGKAVTTALKIVCVGPSNMSNSATGVTGHFNTAIGYENLSNLTSGTENIALGRTALVDVTTGSHNIGIGTGVLQALTETDHNVAIGNGALSAASGTANRNVAIGSSAMAGLTAPLYNVAIGHDAMRGGGSYNVAIGTDTQRTGTSAQKNVLIGYRAMRSATSQFLNVSIGYYAGFDGGGKYAVTIGGYAGQHINTASYITAIGYQAGANLADVASDHTTALGSQSAWTGQAIDGVFIGYKAGYLIDGADESVFIGAYAGYNTAAGTDNTYIGFEAGYGNTTGSNNIAIGSLSGRDSLGDNNVFLGTAAGDDYTLGDSNISIGSGYGYATDRTGGNNIVIGNEINALAAAGDSYKLNIGGIIKGEIDNGVVSIHDILHIAPRAAAPTSPAEGDIYSNSTDNHLYFYNGTAWKQMDNA